MTELTPLKCLITSILLLVGVSVTEGQLQKDPHEIKSPNSRYTFNVACNTERNLILNSIEVNQDSVVVNFSFINTSLAYRDSAFIFAAIKDREQAFYIEDVQTKKKYYAYDATIGKSAKSPTYLRLGEAKRFKLFFPALGSTKKISIKEGMRGPDWSFNDIDLQQSPELLNDSFLSDSSFQRGLRFMSEKDFEEASSEILGCAAKYPENDYVQNLAGVISYVLGDNQAAVKHFKMANTLKPKEHQYFFNIYFVREASGDKEEALSSISSAIQLNPDQPEYYQFRALLYMDMKSWENAVSDLDRFINSDRAIPGRSYFLRGVAKSFLHDESACLDFKEAHSLAKSEKDKEVASRWLNKLCR